MCTLVFAVRPSPDVLLAVTGNRNEFLARPASPPRVWPELPGVLMPRDEMAGGTWLGLTARGLFVCVTNRRGAAPDPARRSRGLLVLEALRGPDAAAVLRPPMQRHGPSPLEGACVHADEFGYGTRSSIQLVLRSSGPDLLWTQGHPCTEPPTDLSPAAAALVQAQAN